MTAICHAIGRPSRNVTESFRLLRDTVSVAKSMTKTRCHAMSRNKPQNSEQHSRAHARMRTHAHAHEAPRNANLSVTFRDSVTTWRPPPSPPAIATVLTTLATPGCRPWSSASCRRCKSVNAARITEIGRPTTGAIATQPDAAEPSRRQAGCSHPDCDAVATTLSGLVAHLHGSFRGPPTPRGSASRARFVRFFIFQTGLAPEPVVK